MSVKRHPWMKFFPTDFRSDPKVRMCSRAARSLWLDMLGLMHESDTYGHLLIAGRQPNNKQLASILGDTEGGIGKMLQELEDANVFSRTEDGTIFSRRMLRDKAKAERDRANGKGGGNPNLIAPVNEGVNPPDKAHMPDARSQRPEEKDNTPGFEVWYSAYPRHVGRGQAAKAYRAALRKADAATLLAGAQRAARQYAGKDPEFVPYPATWLNGERWLDQAPAATARVIPLGVG